MQEDQKQPVQPKRASAWSNLAKFLFGRRDNLDIYKEEQIQSPMRTIIRTFAANKLSMFALFGFLVLLIIVLVGPMITPVDLSFEESTQQNISPGKNLMAFPEELAQTGIRDLSVGRTFSVGVDNNGKVFVWGKTQVPGSDVAKIPADLPKIVKVAAGFDQIMAVGEDGKAYGWGNDRQRQVRMSKEIKDLTNVVDVAAGFQSSAILTADGQVYFLGNSNLTDFDNFNPYQGQLTEVVLTNDAALGLLQDGTAVYLGTQPLPYRRIPEGVKFTHLAATSKTVGGITTDGKLMVWGSPNYKGEGNIPTELNGKPVAIQGGQYHYTVMLDNGEVVTWGDNTYRQGVTPKSLAKNKYTQVYSGYYQNYLVADKKIDTYGLKGYILGSDGLGRDLWVRVLNGGKWTMTIGALAVLISTVIGIILGGMSGYFGGKIDIFLQRIAEIISSLPFLPFVIILNVIIGNRLTPLGRVYLIMIVLGLLSWTGLNRLVRAQVFSVREQEFITAAKSMGIREWSIILKHIIPNVISVIIVSTTLSFASSMLTESSLSYLGFGVKPPIPTWGNMLNGANNSVIIQNYWWQWVFPSIALSLTVIFVNLIGDGLRDAIDPRSQER